MSKRRTGGRQQAAAAAAGISVSSGRWIERGDLQPRAASPRGRRRADPLEPVWEALLLPLLERHPALTPTTLLEHLQEQKPDQDWTPHLRTLQRRVRQWKALNGPAPDVMFPLEYQPGELAFCDFTRVKRVAITVRGEPIYSVPPSLIGQQVNVKLHHDRLIVHLGSTWVCQLPRVYGSGSHGPRAWCIDLNHLIDGLLRAKPRALLHCRYKRELFPGPRWWDCWQRLLAGGDRDGAARLMVEALHVACRLAPQERVLTFLEQGLERQTLSLSALQQHFRLPPRHSPRRQEIPQHDLASYDLFLVRTAAGRGGSNTADPAAAAQAGTIPQPLAESRRAG